MSITSLILKLAAPLPRIEDYQRYMFVGPHPDDIEIGAGATAAKLAESGRDVCFVICTNGCYGCGNVPTMSPFEVIELRMNEAKRSAERLGVHNVQFLGLIDGGFCSEETLEKELAFYIGLFKPDVIFAPDFAVTTECHKDHLRVGRIASQLAFFAPYKEIMNCLKAEPSPVKLLALYFTAKPNRYVKTGGFLERQLQAIADHASQFPSGSEALRSVSLYLKIRSADFGLRNLCSAAEGFRVMDETHMHCLPEAEL